MKKIILLFVFSAFGYFASNAQTIVAKSQGAPSSTMASPQGTLSIPKTDSKDNKKVNCTAVEKKSCGKAAGKSCCSKKK